jgi:hypothetical protein
MKTNKYATIIGNEKIHSEQVHAGNEILDCLGEGIRNPLLVAQPQQGKTGVAIYVLDRFIKDAKARGLTYQAIYLINLSDNELRKQTRIRLRKAHLDDDVTVIHRNDIDDHEIDTAVDKILIVMDECHYAIDKGSPVHRFLLSHGIDYGNPVDTWENDSVSILSISATPFAHSIREATKAGAFHSIPLPMNPNYYSLSRMMQDGRLIQSMPIITGKRRATVFLHSILKKFMDDCAVSGNGYFVIRQNGTRCHAVRDYISRTFGNDVRVEGYSTNADDEGDIDELDEAIAIEPEKPTVVLIRGTLRAGKTLKTTKYLRGWYESPSAKSDAKLQALRPLGYASDDGHSKFDDVFPVYCSMKEVQEEIGFYENLLGGDGMFVVPSGIRNKSSHGTKHEYEQLVFDAKPTIAEVNAECIRLGISVDPSFTDFSPHAVSSNNFTNIAGELLRNTGYQQTTPGKHPLFNVDASNQNFFGDWEQLQNEKPHLIGKWVVPVKTDRKAARNPDSLIRETTIFSEK